MNAAHSRLAALAGVLFAWPALAGELPEGSSGPLDLPPLDTGEPLRVGLYPLERKGPADPAYERLQKDLLRSLGNFPRTEAFDLATPSRCRADDLSCLVQVGRLAAADQVVHGSVERFGDGYAVRLQLIDVGRTTRREAKRLIQGGGPDLSAAMEASACELMTSERCVGTLKIDGAPAARVRIASRDLGETPWTGSLPVGRHLVRVAKGALSTEDKFVNISFRQTATLAIVERGGMLSFADDVLDPGLLPEALLPPDLPDDNTTAPASALAVPAEAAPDGARPASAAWVSKAFWGSAVASGLFLVSGLAFGIAANAAASEANERFERRTLVPADVALHDSARSRAAWANGSYGLMTLGAVGAGVFFLLDPAAVLGEEAR